MVATVQTGTLAGVAAHAVAVEVSQTRGLPGFDVVGLPEAALRESRVRVLAALRNSGYALPDRRFIVNLAPADLRKSGASFDLAIAIALLCACGLCTPSTLDQTLILGELSLDGRVRSVRGLLAHLRSAHTRGLAQAIVPADDASWAGLCSGMSVHLVEHLRDAVTLLDGATSMPKARPLDPPAALYPAGDLADVAGQESAKRALEIAASGHHNLLMVGPPGAGKTMLASRLCGLLPAPDEREALEIATIASVSGDHLQPELGFARPFRAPHHSCSDAAMVGGGDPIRPGEVTLAHGGVLFLDELPEFRRNVIEALRPTMESGVAVVVRTRQRVIMPARPLVCAAMNPCPCGWAGDKKRICRCSPDVAQRYRSRVSGPLTDRFDLHVILPKVPIDDLQKTQSGDSTATIRTRIERARSFARERERARALALTGSLSPLSRTDTANDPSHALVQHLAEGLEPRAKTLLLRSIDTLGLSARAFGKLLRISRTIADLEQSEVVHCTHVAEAVGYRVLDREAHEAGTRFGSAETAARAGS